MPIICVSLQANFCFTLKLLFMHEIEVKVFRLLVTGKEQVVLCRRVSLGDNDSFPFGVIEAALRVLFGKDFYISFTICPYEK